MEKESQNDKMLRCVSKSNHTFSPARPHQSWDCQMFLVSASFLASTTLKLVARGPLAAYITPTCYIDVKTYNAVWLLKRLFFIREDLFFKNQKMI